MMKIGLSIFALLIILIVGFSCEEKPEEMTALNLESSDCNGFEIETEIIDKSGYFF